MATVRDSLAQELVSARSRTLDGDNPRHAGRHPAEDRAQSSWNNSTTVVQVLRDRLVSRGWSAEDAVELESAIGPAPELEHRPLDLGVGLWR